MRGRGMAKSVATAMAMGAFLHLGGCDVSDITDAADAGVDADAPETVTLHPDASPLPGESECTVIITTGIPVSSKDHVPICTPVEYSTNPPSGGKHWPIWAAYKRYDVSLPRPIYVHNLEHGAVVLAYRCASSCPEVTAMFDAVMQSMAEPFCLAVPGSPSARLVMTPDDELDSPIAATAWGATYTATCLDQASLSQFLQDRLGKGLENTCAQGVDVDDMDGGITICDGGSM